VTVFLVVGGAGLLLLVLSMVLGDIFESFDIGDGAISGLALGIGLVVFGASGVIALAADLGTGWAYALAAALAVAAVFLAQLVVRKLAASEDPPPPPLEGAFGVTTATTDPSGGEVRLEGVRDLESRLAWSDEPIPPGVRILVVGSSGSRVHVERA
jgi:membrane-bound ClpP family serine protease